MFDPYINALMNTWPAAKQWDKDGWRFQDGAGGGKRVCAALAVEAKPDVDLLDQTMADPLVMILENQETLDADLAEKGYGIVDPTLLFACPVDAPQITPTPSAHAYATWPPLHSSVEIWENGGIGTARIDVMERVNGPKDSLLIRNQDSPAATGFIALSGTTAMIHAIEVALDHRRQGVGRKMMAQAAIWAKQKGATQLALAVRKQNSAAIRLYTSFGMHVVGQYHYRAKGNWLVG